MNNEIKLSTTVLVLVLFVLTGGCASKPTLDTPSGRPEIEIESLHIKASDVSSMLANYYVNQGYQIVTQNDQKLVLDGDPQTTWFSRYYYRLTFNYIHSRNKLRVVTRIQRLGLPLMGGNNVSSVDDVPPGRPIGQGVQEVLTGIKDSLINDEQFRGIETGSTENNESSGSEKTAE